MNRMTRWDRELSAYLVTQDTNGYKTGVTKTADFSGDLQTLTKNNYRLFEAGEMDVGSRILFYDDDILTTSHYVVDGLHTYRVKSVNPWGEHYEAILQPEEVDLGD